MLVIPYQTRFAVRSLPLVTLLLVAVNLLVCVVFQAGDSAAYRRAANFYFGSSLPQIEMPRYAAYLERRNDNKAVQVLRAIRTGPSEDEARMILMAMQRDREFMRDLKGGAVVRSDDPAYAEWREQRDRFSGLLGQVVSERFALEPGSSTHCAC